MRSRLPLPLTLLLALGVAAGAHAQDAPASKGARDSTVLPVWNNSNGKLEALLLLEPTGTSAAGVRWRFGSNSFDATLGLEPGDSLGLLCDRQGGLGNAIGNLSGHCLLAAVGDDHNDNGSLRANAGATLSRPGGKLGMSLGNGRDTLPAWLAPGAKAGIGAKIQQNDLTIFGQKNIGREGYVSIGGTYARARLIPAADIAPSVADRWNSRSFTIGGGYGNFGASIVGRVVDTPGQADSWQGLGIGLTWRTPWSGQLSVGAENLVTRGKNPFAPPTTDRQDEGTVPYVRYEQDL